jgi:uncharacterized protein (DUF2336 family)
MPGPIQPSMRKVLNEIAANKKERDAAIGSERSAHASRGAAGRHHGTELDDEMSAHWQRQEEHLEALRQEAAEQTRLLREILARLPTPASSPGTSGAHLP